MSWIKAIATTLAVLVGGIAIMIGSLALVGTARPSGASGPEQTLRQPVSAPTSAQMSQPTPTQTPAELVAQIAKAACGGNYTSSAISESSKLVRVECFVGDPMDINAFSEAMFRAFLSLNSYSERDYTLHVYANAPVKDKYGNITSEIVFDAKMTADLAKRINWSTINKAQVVSLLVDRDAGSSFRSSQLGPVALGIWLGLSQ